MRATYFDFFIDVRGASYRPNAIKLQTHVINRTGKASNLPLEMKHACLFARQSLGNIPAFKKVANSFYFACNQNLVCFYVLSELR